MKKSTAIVLTSIGVLLLMPALGLAAQDMGQVADHVRGQLQPVMKLLTGTLFTTGVGLIGSSLWGFKQMGGSSTGHSLNITARHPVMSGLAGIGLIYLTTVAGIGGVTLFGDLPHDVTVLGTTTIE